jgi:hypothetical protein
VNNTIAPESTITHATYETSFLEFSDRAGNRVNFGPSRVTVEPLDARQKSIAERVADKLVKCVVLLAAFYLAAEIFRAFAAGPLVMVSR